MITRLAGLFLAAWQQPVGLGVGFTAGVAWTTLCWLVLG